MVDTTERVFRESPAPEGTHASDAVTFSVEPVSSSTLDTYSQLADSTVAAPPQRPEWLDAWARHVNPDCVLLFARLGAKPVFAMPLEVVREGLCRTARIPGGSHANGSFFPAMPAFHGLPEMGRQLTAAFRALGAARADLDMIALERLSPRLDGLDNPLCALPHSDSPNLALAADLTGGFEALVERMSGKRKRKKTRAQLRKFEAAGGYRLVWADTPGKTTELLSVLFAMKHERFRKMGVADVFAPPEINAFFQELFAAAAKDDTPRFFLSGLEVGGRLRAVCAYSRTGERIICDFASFAEDELYAASPGEFLFFHDIEKASAEGLKMFDFSVGDEVYKRAWCEIETRQFDVLFPLSAKGHAAAAMKRAKARAKGMVKNNPLAWRLVRMARARNGPKSTPAEDD
ncbi:MAG: GNAT family N-acetyltransferase [Hyphomicrobiales bacterium]|nr:GNAT family N-acetyltransferase [Hyphomicrobiales bacterium]